MSPRLPLNTDQDKTLSQTAAARAQIYAHFVRLFGQLPDSRLIADIRQGHFHQSFAGFSELNHPDFNAGLDHISAYSQQIHKEPDEMILEELGVDRTRIVRGTGHADLNPPYEGLYKTRKGKSKSLLEVKRFYIDSGLIPDDTVHEAPDFLCIELDFMRRLCQREQRRRLTSQDAAPTVRQEREFLKKHLASWVGEYCVRVEKHALTDFYRGVAVILKGYMAVELDYLEAII